MPKLEISLTLSQLLYYQCFMADLEFVPQREDFNIYGGFESQVVDFNHQSEA